MRNKAVSKQFRRQQGAGASGLIQVLSTVAVLLALLLLAPPGSRAEDAVSGDAVTVTSTAQASATTTVTPAAKPAAAAPTADPKKDGGAETGEGLALVTSASHLIDFDDYEQFESQQVRLFYFTDVAALMQMLNPRSFRMGELSLDAKLLENIGTAAAAATAFDTAKAAFDKAQRELSAAETTVAEKQATLDSQKVVQTAAIAEQGAAAAELAKLAADAPADTRTAAQTRVDAARTSVDNANAAATTAQQALDTAKTDVTTKTTARDAASKAQAKANSDMLLALELEGEAFARRRDQQPFWVGPLDVDSRDPVHRIFIYGYPDSQTLLLRGRRDDVKAAGALIAELDQPAPQTRLTLWSMELNMLAPQDLHKASVKYAKQMNDALQTMEGEFSDCREQLAASLSILRDVLGEKVQEWTDGDFEMFMLDKNGQEVKVNTNGLPSYYAQRRFVIYEPDVLYRLGFIDDRSNTERYEDFPFEEDQWWQKYYYTRYMIPDPSNTTTLGEALMVLSLARDDFRREVFDAYEARLNQYLEERCKDPEFKPYHFWRLRRALNLDVDGTTKHGLTGIQISVLNGLQREALDKFLPVARTMFYDACQYMEDNITPEDFKISSVRSDDQPKPGPNLARLESDLLKLADLKSRTFDGNEQALNYGAYDAYNIFRDVIEMEDTLASSDKYNGDNPRIYHDMSRLLGIAHNYVNLFDWAHSEFGLTPSLVQDKVQRMHDSKESFFAPHETEPDVAKADQYLKQLNIAMEDDLDEMFVQPMLKDLRTKLIASKVNVGVVQRTSLLATNRLAAQIIPRDSAELALGRTDDALAAAQQLTQLLPIISDTNVLKAPNNKNFLDKLQGSQQNSEDENLQIYGVTSGNSFHVTPIFDASGQAQRFRFDYTYANQIKDPDGSSGGPNPRLPRTEAMQIDTEVQVDNFEIREISRFENNVRLGLPERKSGGIPILKDIKCFEDIPLIGWFKRRSGESAVVQQTIIFAQSTIYPTVGDIMDVLTQPLPDVEYLYDQDERLQTKREEKADPVKYVWKGQVLFGKTKQESADDAKLSKAGKCIAPFRPAAGVQALVFEENAPGKSQKLASASTDANGVFSVPFEWNARFRYRLLIIHDGTPHAKDGTAFKFIPEITLSEDDKKAGKLPTFDSSPTPIIIDAGPGARHFSEQDWAPKFPACLSTFANWKGQAVLAAGCPATAAEVKDLIPAVQAEYPPGVCPVLAKGSFGADGKFSIDFAYSEKQRVRLVLLDKDGKIAKVIVDYQSYPSDRRNQTTVITFPLS